MSVEAPIQQDHEEPKTQWLTDRLNQSGFQPIENYHAMFFEETKINGEIIDHMVLSTNEDGVEVALGIFALRRTKGETDLDNYLSEYPINEQAQQAETKEMILKQQVSFSVREAKEAFDERMLPEAKYSAILAKWYDGRMHTFVINENSELVVIYSVNPDKIQTAREYIKSIKGEIKFQQNREEYADNMHP